MGNKGIAMAAVPGSSREGAKAWRSLFFSVIMICAGGAPAAFGHGARLGTISIGHFWSPESDATGGIVSVFGPVFNGGSKAVTLSGIATPIARRSGICTQKDGNANWLSNATVAPSKVLALAQWREHICLDGVDRALKHGDVFPITLDFGKAGTVSIDVYVGVEGD